MNKLLINEPPLQVLPSLAVKFGLNEAIVIQQIHYWLKTSNHDHDGYKWVYNSIKQWQGQFPFWSTATLNRIFGNLVKSGVLVSGNYNQHKFDRTLWYRIDYGVFSMLSTCETPFSQNDQMEFINLTEPIPETNQETTTEKEKVKKEISSDIKLLSEKVIEHLNYRTGNKFRANGKQVLEVINARVNDKYKLDDFIRVIDIKCEEWLDDPKSFTWLRPSTLFGPKMEHYASQVSFEDKEMAEAKRSFEASQKRDNKQDELF